MSMDIKDELISKNETADLLRLFGAEHNAIAVVMGVHKVQATKVSCLQEDCKYNQDSMCTKDEITLYGSHCCDGGCDDGWELKEEEL